MEPITSAVVQFLILGTPLSITSVLSLPVIVGGAIMFSGNPVSQNDLSLGIAAAFTSNIILALRNVALKMNSAHQAGIEISMQSVSRPTMAISGIWAFGCMVAWTQGYIPDDVVYNMATCLLSGIFHVIYSYVSTAIVLSHLSVVSHAVTNILKRVLVVLLLYLTGSRIASPTNFLGLGICTTGLLVYAWSKRVPKDLPDNKNTVTEKPALAFKSRTKVKFLLISTILFSALALGIFQKTTLPQNAYYKVKPIFKPPVSHFAPKRNLGEFGDLRFERTFTHLAHEQPKTEDLLPDVDGYLAKDANSIEEFLHEDLNTNPNRSSFLSRKLRTHVEIIKESQRLHFTIMGEALKSYKYAMLLDIASFENKGDPCISIGEIYFLARINLKVVYYCGTQTCSQPNLKKAADKARTFSPKELVILIHGGGNIAGYAFSDLQRFFIFEIFKGFKIFVFPQSIWIRYNNFEHPHVKRCMAKYCCNENVTFVMRDHLSYKIAQNIFNGTTKFILAPDMAFQIGPVARFLSPVFDIMWIRRKDAETPGYKMIPSTPPGVRLHVSDWWQWYTPRAPSSLEKAHYICTNGFFYLQRGRVVITDRLHGHILATLLNIPHVVIDNSAHKLSAYHLSWTASLENTVLTNDPRKAVDLAVELLKRYNSTLPPRVPFLHIDEHHVKDKTFESPNLMFP
ncbi:pyruvyl transferase 1 [Plakobranchus ocellatus]|uniref:Pyruvyl transferase 1 n=1 Tax=Plakobranchus ocellatus TaxID=259542 RepID=A0AAV4DPI0_9GAST|nr:pyruvyl transferase 1 [Plakobranchus ocellatus]